MGDLGSRVEARNSSLNWHFWRERQNLQTCRVERESYVVERQQACHRTWECMQQSLQLLQVFFYLRQSAPRSDGPESETKMDLVIKLQENMEIWTWSLDYFTSCRVKLIILGTMQFIFIRTKEMKVIYLFMHLFGKKASIRSKLEQYWSSFSCPSFEKYFIYLLFFHYNFLYSSLTWWVVIYTVT